MRTLIIDNFDSFTFNLYQLIAEMNGQLPTVVRNVAEWDHLRRREFDNIVISPGPGRPERRGDFGICSEAIAEAEVPVLCVCLGHQGLGYLFGADVVLAPEAMHGRLSRIRHDQSALFVGIPQDAWVVRYHSLMLTSDLPPDLVRTAWTHDDIVMGIRHRSRPLWGVQFHPESIGTEYGVHILDNFRTITLKHHGCDSGHPRAAAPPIEPARSARSRNPRGQGQAPWQLWVRKLASYPDPESVFVHLFGTSQYAFWLDSSLESASSRFHIMGDASGPLSSVIHYDLRRQRVVVESATAVKIHDESIFTYLRRELQRCRIEPAPELPFDFAGGYVGYLGYELKAECGGDDIHAAATPAAGFVFVDRALVFDAVEKQLYALCLAESGGRDAADGWFDTVEARLATIPTLSVVRDSPPVAPISFRLAQEPSTYLANIGICLEQIRRGESYEICLTNRIFAESDIDPLAFHRVLRRSNPAPYAAFLRLGELAVACSSPERFLCIGRDRWVESKPIKGTLPRGQTPIQDARLRAELQQSEKHRSENLMIVDLVRNDLGRVCKVGTVHVPTCMDVESYATVHQLVSTVRGQLRDDMSAVDCVQAAFPGGSMTGAPKIRTMQIIDQLEAGARGIYAGTIGFLSLNGAADLNIVIRTAVFHPPGVAIGVGGAIVALSDADAELEESLLKGRSLMEVAAQLAAGNRREQQTA